MATIYTLKDGTEIDYSTEEGLRLLDCEIARRFGWTDIRKNDGSALGRGDWIGSATGSLDFTIWPYTTDTDIALSMLGDLFAIIYKLRDIINDVPREGWVVKIKWEDNEVLSPHAYDNTLALAICLAWLAWKDAQE